jgi:hypothetical protein
MNDPKLTPPLELVRKWQREANHNEAIFPQVAVLAAQWGADQELEACRMEIIDGEGRFYIDETSDRVRLAEDIWTARRPKPPTQSKYDWLEPLDRRIKQVQEETEAIKKEIAALAALHRLYTENGNGMKRLADS